MSTRRTPLFEAHEAEGAKMTDFGGWEMPVQYRSIREEHHVVRDGVGIFDVSHMSELEITGPDAGTLCQMLTTNDVNRLTPGEAQYTVVPDDAGTIVDDAILYQLGDNHFLLVANAGKDELLTRHWAAHRDDLAVEIADVTEDWGMLAVQGPDTAAALPIDIGELDRLTVRRDEIAGVDCLCARTGYTGEAGVELLVPWDETPKVAQVIDGPWCGLGARDTLRLEMGFVLAGNEFDREDNRRTPFEAGLEFAIDLSTDPSCLGHETLVRERERGPAERLVGFVMEERGIPRHGYAITDRDGTEIGTVTSGTMSPTLGEPIGMGYVAVEWSDPGTEVAVAIRESHTRASIVSPPFVDPER